MPRLRLTIAYVGTNYHGWQTQALWDGDSPPTVQSCVEKAVSRICGLPVHVHGSGRTDAGVHADAQTAHCDIPAERAQIRWQAALNTLLPRDIRIMDARLAPQSFDAQKSVYRKKYIYSLWTNLFCTPPRISPFVWSCGPLDLSKIDEAMPYLTGEHDFAAMQNAGTPHKSTVRTLYELRRTKLPVKTEHGIAGGSVSAALAYLSEKQNRIDITFVANGFLKQMVRNITGLLVACGRGKFSPSGIPELLLSCDRRKAPFTAPPQGLTMSSVWYEGEPMPEGWEE